jgi:membrane-associated phospholipid phosphatase
MNISDYVIDLILSVFLIVGVYQFYFWCQRNYVTQPRALKIPLDDAIPYWPGWVWIYSGLYYPVIVYINFTVESPRQFLHIAMSYILLLAAQMAFFVFFPVATPNEWRAINQRRGHSEKFLAFVQSLDSPTNSFPSMHTSVAMLTAMHLMPHLGMYALLFPLLIAISCVFTKQHYLLDLPAGALLGWMIFRAYQFMA